MSASFDENAAEDLEAARTWLSRAIPAHGIIILLLAICPAVVSATFASRSGRWDIFERSGSIITAVGLLFASRRYVKFGVLELALLQSNGQARQNVTEVLRDVLTSKFGLALSAFGTVIWGWGAYLGWWSFGYLALWAMLAFRDARRDLGTFSADERG